MTIKPPRRCLAQGRAPTVLRLTTVASRWTRRVVVPPVVVFCFTLGASCGAPAVRSERVVLPSGVLGAAVECRRPMLCWQKAGELCPDGYNVLTVAISRENDRSAADGLSAAGQTLSGATVVVQPPTPTVDVRSLLISCKAKASPPKRPPRDNEDDD